MEEAQKHLKYVSFKIDFSLLAKKFEYYCNFFQNKYLSIYVEYLIVCHIIVTFHIITMVISA